MINDELIIRVYNKQAIHEIKEELYDFLIELNEEKETFLEKPLTDPEYSKSIHGLIERTIFVATAWKDKHIIGVDGVNIKKVGPFLNPLPIVRGYTVVKKTYQGRGIGTRLSHERDRYLEKIWVFYETVIKKNNTRMIKIDTNPNKFTFNDDEFVYGFKTLNRLLSRFTPVFIPLYGMYRRARKRASV